MSDIVVKKHDEVFLRVFCDDSIARELSEYFTFDVPGAKFQPSFKARLWDGKKRLFNLHTKTLYVGLFPLLENFAKKLNYSLEIDELLKKNDNISRESIEKFLPLIKPCSNGNPLTIRDYQLDAIVNAIQKERILLISPTGSGKSLLIYCIIRWYAAQKKKCLVIVPTTSLVEQLYTDFQDYSNSQWNVEKNVQKFYSGQSKNISNNTKVIISTWQSLIKYNKKWFNQFDVLFGDECLHPDTQITMSNGELKKISTLSNGDVVKTVNEITGVIEDKPIVKVHKNISNEKMYLVKTKSGLELKITGNHKIFTKTGWKRTDELSVGESVKIYE